MMTWVTMDSQELMQPSKEFSTGKAWSKISENIARHVQHAYYTS